ncbi:uncharacterized protein Pyn_20833 [Prunus yedoensis var. nudiflora]|uniref:RNase H type-1 domain-containing protein n=1 Tax=Prunus yedoensis var. nudiflora TaxID=2094558 RepID=A0A314ZAX0_PRUYE|nr:uncharacterized protein Pyn_20833 [Prunus yedoensis var. nudiflora]
MGANESRGGSGSGNNDEDGDGSRRKRNTGVIVAAGAGAVAGALLAYGLSRKVSGSGSGSESQLEQKEEEEKPGRGGVQISSAGFEDNSKQKALTMQAWMPPPASTMKLNIDGSRNSSSSAIAAGGLIRNSAAQRMQVTKLIVETDSESVLRILNANLEDHDPLLILRNKCRSYWKSSWDCKINHVYREVNSAADFLAKMGRGMEMGTHFFDKPPDGIIGVLQDDRAGRSRPRLISV